MKLTNLILDVAVCFSSVMLTEAQENYSYWPRRPQEFEQAQLLLSQQKWAEAAHVLQPFVHDMNGFGVEARTIVGRINVVRYLSRMHPSTSVYTVRRGDTLPKISEKKNCPVDLLMLFNGLTEPSSLKIGQKLVCIDMTLRIEIYTRLNELTVWDGDALVASYKIHGSNEEVHFTTGEEEVTLVAREARIRGKRIPDNSAKVAIADKVLHLSNGVIISSSNKKDKNIIPLSQNDINELALLVRVGNIVQWK